MSKQILGQDSNIQPFINGSDFNTTFILKQFHFHWGYNNMQGSEHHIHEKKFPLEVSLTNCHLVKSVFR